MQTGVDRLQSLFLRGIEDKAFVLSGGIAGVREAFADIDEDFRRIMERYIQVSEKSGISLEYMVKSYIFLIEETNKEERYFYEHGTYRYRTLEEVMNRVYNNKDYMKKYMVGLAVSAILWRQHRRYFQFFSSFIKANAYHGSYLEIGAGHGLFTSIALLHGGFEMYDILDISETSLSLVRSVVEEFSIKKNIRFFCKDFLNYNESGYDVISIGEVLEHVEKPLIFLKKCHNLVQKNGRVYLTTCINAPEIDHIFLFSNVDELEELFAQSDLDIVERLYIPYHSYSMERCQRQKLPINVAYVLKPVDEC